MASAFLGVLFFLGSPGELILSRYVSIYMGFKIVKSIRYGTSSSSNTIVNVAVVLPSRVMHRTNLPTAWHLLVIAERFDKLWPFAAHSARLCDLKFDLNAARILSFCSGGGALCSVSPPPGSSLAGSAPSLLQRASLQYGGQLWAGVGCRPLSHRSSKNAGTCTLVHNSLSVSYGHRSGDLAE